MSDSSIYLQDSSHWQLDTCSSSESLTKKLLHLMDMSLSCESITAKQNTMMAQFYTMSKH